VLKATGFQGCIYWDTRKLDCTPKNQLDVSRLAQLGWRAQAQLDDGLRNTMACFRDQLGHQLLRL